jgi:Tfp pilus assembly protein PilX
MHRVPPRTSTRSQTGNPAAAIILLTVACVLALLAAMVLRRLLKRDRITANPATTEIAAA